jgi:hypothetical protein
MIQQECSFGRRCDLDLKSTPGERCSWLTITRSEPLTMNSPPPIIIRDLAEVDLFFDRRRAADEANVDLERIAVGQAQLAALVGS